MDHANRYYMELSYTFDRYIELEAFLVPFDSSDNHTPISPTTTSLAFLCNNPSQQSNPFTNYLSFTDEVMLLTIMRLA